MPSYFREMSKAAHSAARSPFLRLGAPRRHRLFRLAATVLLGLALAVVLAGLTVHSLEAALGPEPGDRPLLTALRERMSTAFVVGSLGASVWIAASLVHWRNPRTFVTAAPRFRWGLLVAGLLMVAPLATSVILLLLRPAEPAAVAPGPAFDRFFFAGGVLLLTLVSAFGEEVVLRGWLLQQAAAFTSRLWLVLGVSAVAFTALHLSGDALQLTMRLLSGLTLAWTVLRLGGLEFAIGAHAGRNAAIFWWDDLSGAEGGGLTAAAIGSHLAITVVTLAAGELLVRSGRVRLQKAS